MKRHLLLLTFIVAVLGCRELPPAPNARIEPPKPQPKLTYQYAVPVLMYHRVSTLTDRESRSPLIRDLTVSPEDFENQIKYLAENGFTFLLAREVEAALRQGRSLPERAVAITLDDGYRDNFSNVFPILRKYGARATVFLVTDNIGRKDRLSWGDLLAMRSGGVSYGSHSVSHADLVSAGQVQRRYELRESKRVLEEGLGQPITSLAYPAGRYDETVVFEARSAGYLAGWKKGGGPVEPSNAAEPLLLPRVRVHGRTTPKDFERKVWSGVYVRQARVAASQPSARRKPS